jgi:hypothetical protein
MDDIEKKRRLETEPDFVNLKRFGYSLETAMNRYPDGAPDNVVAAALCISEAEVESRYQTIVQKLRSLLGA